MVSCQFSCCGDQVVDDGSIFNCRSKDEDEYPTADYEFLPRSDSLVQLWSCEENGKKTCCPIRHVQKDAKGMSSLQISVQWNPGCPRDTDCAHAGIEQYHRSVNSLLHFTAKANEPGPYSNQTVHIVFSTVGGPALLMLLTSNNAKIRVDWNSYLNETERGDGSLTVTGDVFHSMGVLFTRVRPVGVALSGWILHASVSRFGYSMIKMIRQTSTRHGHHVRSKAFRWRSCCGRT